MKFGIAAPPLSNFNGFAIFIVNTNAPDDIVLVAVDAVFMASQDSAFAMEVIAADRALHDVMNIFL